MLRLEARDVPSAPSVSNLSGRALGDYWVLTGLVNDEDAAHAQVNISGSASGAAQVAADGSFEFITQHSGSGSLSILAHDTEGLDSNPEVVNISPSQWNLNPYLSMTMSYGTQRTVTFSGKVYDESPGGLTVTISGVASGTVVTDSTGSFSITLTASALGNAFGHTVDAQGAGSNTVLQTVASNAPQIQQFYYSVEGSTIKVRGKVVDESPVGLTVTLGGTLGAFAGKTATVGADGWFEYTATFSGSIYGVVTAACTDWWGLASNTADTTISI